MWYAIYDANTGRVKRVIQAPLAALAALRCQADEACVEVDEGDVVGEWIDPKTGRIRNQRRQQ